MGTNDTLPLYEFGGNVLSFSGLRIFPDLGIFLHVHKIKTLSDKQMLFLSSWKNDRIVISVLLLCLVVHLPSVNDLWDKRFHPRHEWFVSDRRRWDESFVGFIAAIIPLDTRATPRGYLSGFKHFSVFGCAWWWWVWSLARHIFRVYSFDVPFFSFREVYLIIAKSIYTHFNPPSRISAYVYWSVPPSEGDFLNFRLLLFFAEYPTDDG